MKDRNTNKGITLIALVITIIVMLILVSVTISMAVNGGLFDYAGKATGDTKNAIEAEQKLSNGAIQVDGVWYDSIDDYLKGEPSGPVKIKLSISGTNVTEVPVPTGFTHTEGTIDTGYVIEDASGNEFVWVPVKQGQKISLNVESEKDIKELKIYDPYGDVILTVADGDIETTYSNTTVEPTVNGMYMAVATTEDGITQKTLTVKSLYAMDTWNDWWGSDAYAKTLGYDSFENWALDYVKENGFESVDAALQAMGYPTIEVALSAIQAPNYKRYQDMKNYTADVEKNGGFYIARYEAGIPEPKEARTSGSTDNSAEMIATIISDNGVPVSKEGAYPYNYITNDQAIGLAESMYNSEEFTDTLLTHSAWDRTVGWIYETKGKTLAQICDDSGSWGNYYDVTFDITEGKYSEDWGSTYTEVSGKYTKQKEDYVLLTTGATTRNSTNNIFDLAGNVWEWTLSSYTSDDGSSDRTSRGGRFLRQRRQQLLSGYQSWWR